MTLLCLSRYHIHHFNRDDLLLCILPYHEMKIFVRVLQLLKLDNPADKWNWLEACAVCYHDVVIFLILVIIIKTSSYETMMFKVHSIRNATKHDILKQEWQYKIKQRALSCLRFLYRTYYLQTNHFLFILMSPMFHMFPTFTQMSGKIITSVCYVVSYFVSIIDEILTSRT